MSIYDERPWLAQYPPGVAADLEPEARTGLDLWDAALDHGRDRALVHYFGSTLTTGDVDEASDALAAALEGLGVGPGDRVALYLQNVPQFLLALLAVWKRGAVVVPVNPMLKERELRLVLQDSGAAAIVTLESLQPVVAAARDGTDLEAVVTTSELDYAEDPPDRLFSGVGRRRPAGAHDLLQLVEAHAGSRPPRPRLTPDDTAFLTYTSGTTGPPKGAMNTHGNVAFNAHVLRDWIGLTPDDVLLAVAPLFHITGLVAHLAVALLVPMPVVLGYRFDPAVMAALAERHRATFTVGSITVFIALMNDAEARTRDLSSLTKVYSGGAPVAPATVEAFQRQFGAYIHNIYGLTETTSPSHAVPFGRSAPVDPTSGALSVGVPVPNTVVRVVDEHGGDLPPGEIGELVTSGPQVVPGYWNKPEETAHALPGGRLHTGDVGFMDADGWFYLVDRKKDMIVASGFKVWPREVEDVLYQHPAVREAAVVGVPDAYRGETVKAFVSLKPGERAEPDELIAFCKERLAAYKYPRTVEVLADLPKTVTGKILRRELRG